LLQRIDGIKKSRDIAPSIAALHQVGIPVVFNFSADIDLRDLDRHVGYFSQGGLGLPDPAYYTRSDADARALLSRYVDYVKKILILTGVPQTDAASDALRLPPRLWSTCVTPAAISPLSRHRALASSTATCNWMRS
jgi:putative endopeptidase